MQLYIIASNYTRTGYFGAYSTMKRARKALEHYLTEASEITHFEEISDYTYQFTTNEDETYSAEIMCDILDWEFEKGEIEDEMP